MPYINDGDPDWSAGATLMAASCGEIAASTMKDGWTYAGNLSPSLSFRWQYPNTSYPFPIVDPLNHGDIRYHRAGAAWNDTYYSMSGGQQILDTSDPSTCSRDIESCMRSTYVRVKAAAFAGLPISTT